VKLHPDGNRPRDTGSIGDLVNEEIDIDVRVGDVREHHFIPHHLAAAANTVRVADYLEGRRDPRASRILHVIRAC